MARLTNGLITQKYTYIAHEDDIRFNAPHHFIVNRVGDDCTVGVIDFQEGPIKENGVNGVANEDLIAMVIARLQGFQNSEYACRENAVAVTKLEEALMWLRKRTLDREARQVEGTSQI
ncbi:MAG: ABC transporter ATPase [Eubacteriales bacterium]